VLTGLHGILLGRQPEGVVAQAVQDVLAEHPVEAREDVGRDVAQRVPDVQARSARVGEHVEDEQVPAGVRGDPVRVAHGPAGFGAWKVPSLLPAVLPGHLDLPGQLGGVAVRRFVAHRALLSFGNCRGRVERRCLVGKKKPLTQEGLPR
jgi:hypothetical protein